MPSLKYDIQYDISSSPISVGDLVARYFFGIPLVDPAGNSMSDAQIQFYIDAAQEQVEGLLGIKLGKQIIEETVSYTRQDYINWGFLPTSFPVIEAISLQGNLGTIEQVVYPKSWLSVRKSTDPTAMYRQVSLVPTSGAADTSSVVYSGVSPHVGWFGSHTIPNYWTIRYCTSFEKIPSDILNVVGKLASFNVLNILGDLILGAGIASQSIGIDGLSQSISSTSSATNSGYGGRITQYQKELKEEIPLLKEKYRGINFIAV